MRKVSRTTDAEPDAAAQAVARSAAAAGNGTIGLSAGGFVSLGAAGPLGTAALSAKLMWLQMGLLLLWKTTPA